MCRCCTMYMHNTAVTNVSRRVKSSFSDVSLAKTPPVTGPIRYKIVQISRRVRHRQRHDSAGGVYDNDIEVRAVTVW